MKIFGAALIMIVTGTMFLGLFHVSMNMADRMTDCPFMLHSDGLCPMSIAEHLGAWKSFFLSTAPTTIILLVGALLVSAVVFAPHLFVDSTKLLAAGGIRLRARRYRHSYRPLQELFASGILHPKLF
jgi:hypothetical protein